MVMRMPWEVLAFNGPSPSQSVIHSVMFWTTAVTPTKAGLGGIATCEMSAPFGSRKDGNPATKPAIGASAI